MDFSILAEAFEQFGFTATLLGVVVIATVGFFKTATKKRLEEVSKESRKSIYELASIIVSAVVAWVYFLATGHENAEVLLKEVAMVYAATKILYPLYENFRLRDLLGFVVDKAKQKLEEVNDGRDK